MPLDESTPPAPPEPPVRRRGLWLTGGVLVLLALAVVVTGVLSRRTQAADLQERAASQAMRTVAVVTPSATGAAAALDLPGRVEAFARAPLYARVSGYLKRWNADIGTTVNPGQVLAEIETPELDQQLLQARAELATAQANAALSATTAKRWQSLLATDAVSRQEADEKAGDLAAKQSVVNALSANVERLAALKGFAQIVAPFGGVVIARNTDVGALVNVGGGPGSELFVVADTRKLRVYVNVPQGFVGAVKAGTQARLTVPERPGQNYVATVQSSAQAINSSTGSMLVQLAVDNGDGTLLPGGFASVRFELPASPGTLSIPPGALLFGKAGLRVATVGAGDQVVLKPVRIARDLGTSVEIASGLVASDRVIDSPPDGIENGDRVRVAERGTGASK